MFQTQLPKSIEPLFSYDNTIKIFAKNTTDINPARALAIPEKDFIASVITCCIRSNKVLYEVQFGEQNIHQIAECQVDFAFNNSPQTILVAQ